MLPKVPSFTNLRACNTPPSRVSTCNGFADIGHYLQQKAVVEGVLHVSAAQARSCMQRFEDLEGPSAPALPALPSLLAATAAHSADDELPGLATPTPTPSALTTVSSTGERVMQEAFCLATPPDNPAENSSILWEPVPGAARTSPAAPSPTGSNISNNNTSNNSSSSQTGRFSEPAGASIMRRPPPRSPSTNNLLLREAEEVSQLEVAACQHAAAIGTGGLNSSILKASEAMARLRRRKLRRLLRSTRDASTTLMTSLQQLPGDPGFVLASIGDSLATLSSWDTDDSSLSEVGAASEANSSSSRSHTWAAEVDLSIEEEYLGWYADPSAANAPHRGCRDCCGTCHFAC